MHTQLNPHLSVIIPMYNNLEKVTRAYRTVVETTDPAITEVLIQDDASPECNGVVAFGDKVAQRNDFNLGFGGNCNRATQRARGTVYLFLNQDCYVPPEQAGWDRRLLQTLDENPMVGIVGPTLLFPNGTVQSVGGGFDAAGQPYHVALGAQNPDWEPINTPRDVAWITGAAFAVRVQVWMKLGGFDKVYGRGYFEDVDMCMLMRHRLQLKVWHEPRIRFYHEVGSAGGTSSFARNAIIFKQRWVDTGIVKPDVPTLKVRYWA